MSLHSKVVGTLLIGRKEEVVVGVRR